MLTGCADVSCHKSGLARMAVVFICTTPRDTCPQGHFRYQGLLQPQLLPTSHQLPGARWCRSSAGTGVLLLPTHSTVHTPCQIIYCTSYVRLILYVLQRLKLFIDAAKSGAFTFRTSCELTAIVQSEVISTVTSAC